MPQLEKLHAQENEMQQQKQQQEKNLQQDVNVEHHHHEVVQNDVEALRDAQVAQSEDAPHQNDEAQALKEEDVDKLLNPFFSIFLF